MTPEQVRAIVTEEIARAEANDVEAETFLEFLQQAIGLKPSTFTDAQGNPDPRVQAIRDYIQAMAKGGVTAPLIYAKQVEALEAAVAVLKKATVGR